MTDTHCHLDFPKFDKDREQVIDKTLRELKAVINVGAGLNASRKAVKLAEKNDQIYAAVGIHPHNTEPPASPTPPDTQTQIVSLRDLAKSSNKIVAIGEIGLDYSFTPNQTASAGSGQASSGEKDLIKAKQKELFRAQIRLAKELDLPLIIHSRDAIKDTLGILREEEAARVVFHCFTYNKTWAQKVLDTGYLLSFTGIVTFQNARVVQETVKYVPLNKMMVETDSPFLAPEPFRGQRCEPWMVKYVVSKIAELKGIDAGKIEKATDENAAGFFNFLR